MNHHGRIAVVGVCLLALAAGGAGCSQDKHKFRSTVFHPTTISLRDLVSKQIIWSKEVPVGHDLVLDLDRPGDLAPFRIGTTPATKMKWWLVKSGTMTKVEKGHEKLPGVPVLIERTHRPAPEYPPGYSPGDAPGDAPGDGESQSEPESEPAAAEQALESESAPEVMLDVTLEESLEESADEQ